MILTEWKEPPRDKVISIDFETLPDSFMPEIMALAWDETGVVYDLLAADVEEEFFKFLDNCKSINAHNIEFELKVLKTWGYDIHRLEGRIDDSMVMIAVNDTEQPKGLKDACTLVGKQLREWKEASKDTREAYMQYCLDDALTCHKLLYYMIGVTEKNETWAVYNMEMDCIWWAVDSYFWGVYIDMEKLMEFRNKYTQKIQECMERMIELSGKVINFNSTEQLRDLLFNVFELKPATEFFTNGGKNGTPLPSTSLSALKFYSESKNSSEVTKQFLKTLLEYRKYSKLRNTYTSDKFIKWVWNDGKIHPNVFLTGTRTGRMSYRDPPMQTIPSRGDGAELRNIVAASPGTFLVRADLGQMEYRLLAHFTQDAFLLDAYRTGRDLHEETGKLFGVSRDAGKQLNFSIVYGQGISALSAKIKKDKKETSVLMQKYFERFSKVKEFKESAINYAYANKHIKTISGRIRGLSKYMEQEDGSVERLAVNTIIQGCMNYDALIPTENGIFKIGDLSGKEFKVFNRYGLAKAKAFSTGVKEVFKINFTDGTVLYTTKDHKFLVIEEDFKESWVELENITGDMFILGRPMINNKNEYHTIENSKYYEGLQSHNKRNSYDYKLELDEEHAWMLGTMIGDGSFGDTYAQCVFPKHKLDNCIRFKEAASKISGNDIRIEEMSGKNKEMLRVSCMHKAIRSFFESCGLEKATAKDKKTPSLIFTSSNKVIASYLNGLFTTDGSATKNGGFKYTTTSEYLATDVCNLLNILGIDSKLVRRGSGAFDVNVNKDSELFLSIVGMSGRYKKEQIESAEVSKRHSVPADLPLWLSKIIAHKCDSKLTRSATVIKSRAKKKALSRKTALLMFKSEYTEYKFIEQNYFKKISSVTSYGFQETFDISVLEGEHEYIANGTVVHNCNAEIVKMIICKQRRQFKDTGIKCILQVHDELIFEFPNSYDRKKAEKVIEKLMTETYPLSIPVEASVLAGSNWSEAKD